MSEFITSLLAWLSANVPLEMLAVVASGLEEIIAPIPSPLVGALVGSLALSEGYTVIMAVLFFGFLMAVGKTIACVLIYWVMRYASEVTVTKLEKFIDVTPEDLTKLSRFFTGKLSDYILLTLVRAIPFLPSSPISVVAGIVKIPLRLYAITTFIGSYIRSGLFIFAGYAGYETLQTIPYLQEVLFVTGSLALLWFVYWIYRKSKG